MTPAPWLRGKRCVLFPCPGCGRTRTADEGHHLCRECEGYAPTDEARGEPTSEGVA